MEIHQISMKQAEASSQNANRLMVNKRVKMGRIGGITSETASFMTDEAIQIVQPLIPKRFVFKLLNNI